MKSSATKVGLFALAALVIIGFITLKVGSRSFVAGGGYELVLVVDSAVGIRTKTPVEVAGIKVGKVRDIRLLDSMKAELTLGIDSGVHLPLDTKAMVRSKGFLGEIVIELIPGAPTDKAMADGDTIQFAGQGGDVNMLLTQFNSIANDIKAVSTSLRGMVAGEDANSPVWNIVKNLEQFTQTLSNNQANFNKMSDNLAALTDALRGTVAQSRENVEQSIERIASITKKVDEGKGTIGKLVNDDTTVNNLNEAVVNLNKTLGGLRSLQSQIGYHMEYLGSTSQFKNYVHLNLKPAPDKAFMFEFVQDSKPSPNRATTTSTITTGGASTTVTTENATIVQNQLRFSAELAKEFYDFTVRGGIIESRGGFGLDYNKGPASLQFSAFDFETDYQQKPHLKMLGMVNLTKNFYVVGGADDFISRHDKSWFMGGGFRLVEDDVKSLLGIMAGSAASMAK